MMKILAIVLCMSLLVSSQDLMGDGMGGLMALNMLSGRPMFDISSMFGGSSGQTGAGGQRSSLGNNFGGFAGLLMFDAI
jgi:hypothetical protein